MQVDWESASFFPVQNTVTFRDFLGWFYGPYNRWPSRQRYWRCFMAATEALDRPEARFRYDFDGHSGMCRVVSLEPSPGGRTIWTTTSRCRCTCRGVPPAGRRSIDPASEGVVDNAHDLQDAGIGNLPGPLLEGNARGHAVGDQHRVEEHVEVGARARVDPEVGAGSDAGPLVDRRRRARNRRSERGNPLSLNHDLLGERRARSRPAAGGERLIPPRTEKGKRAHDGRGGGESRDTAGSKRSRTAGTRRPARGRDGSSRKIRARRLGGVARVGAEGTRRPQPHDTTGTARWTNAGTMLPARQV